MKLPASRMLTVGFVLLPLVEFALLVVLGSATSFWVVLGVIGATAVVGALLAARAGKRTWRELQEALRDGRLPATELADASLIFIGGVLLILPGLLCDLAGLALLIPATRRLIRRRLGWQLPRHQPHATIVEGEVVDDEQSSPAEVISGEIIR